MRQCLLLFLVAVLLASPHIMGAESTGSGGPAAEELYQLGVRLFDSPDPDKAAAMAAWEQAAQAGHIQAMFNLGMAFRAGVASAPDPLSAYGWFEKAARLGDVKAMFELAELCADPAAMILDSLNCAAWYRRAAEAGEPRAQYKLGLMLESGYGIKGESMEAATWFLKAARQGSVEAQHKLGTLFLTEGPFSRDLVQAYLWLWMAAVNAREADQSQYRDSLQACETLMDDTQLLQARSLLEAIMDCYEQNRL